MAKVNKERMPGSKLVAVWLASDEMQKLNKLILKRSSPSRVMNRSEAIRKIIHESKL